MLLRDFVRVWLRKQLKGTAWLSAVSSQSGRGTRGARVVQVGAGWAGRGAKFDMCTPSRAATGTVTEHRLYALRVPSESKGRGELGCI